MVKDWPMVLVGDILDFKNGLNKGKEYFGYGTPIVNYTDVYHHSGLYAADIKGSVSLTKDEIKRFEVRKNDVFFTRTSETPEEVGLSAVLLEDIPYCAFSGFVLRGRPKNDILVPEYCKYCFSSKAIREKIISNCTYTTRALTNGRVLSAIEIPVPPKEEQTAIASALSYMEQHIANLAELIEKKKAIRDGVLKDLMNGSTRLGYSKEWKSVPFEQFTKQMVDGPFGSDLKTEHYTRDHEARVIQLSNIGDDGWNDENTKYTTYSHAKELSRCITKPGELLIAKMMPAGRAILCPTGENMYIISSDVVRVILDDTVDSRFIVYSTKGKYYLDQISENTQGSTRQRTSIRKLKKIRLLLPEYEEQKAIADVLTVMDDEITALEDERNKMIQIREGAMDDLLTGRVRLMM